MSAGCCAAIHVCGVFELPAVCCSLARAAGRREIHRQSNRTHDQMMEVAISVLFSQYVCYKRARVCRYIPKFSSMLYQLNYIQARQSLEKTIQQRYSLWDVVYSHSAAIFISSFLLLHWFLYSQWSVPPVWLKQKGI